MSIGKIMKVTVAMLVLFLILTSCKNTKKDQTDNGDAFADAVSIVLSDDGITFEGETVGNNEDDAVYVANDIVYYESGKGIAYGEGESSDEHTSDEAKEHTVVHITKAGTYRLNGTLSRGQIAVDLGKGSKKDENAVVTLILDNTDITCTVAPAIIFYNVYECGDKDGESASKTVDTSKAGANVVIADGTVNNVNGSYVAKIYKPDSVVLNDSKTLVEDADKLHKYDGALYSKMSLNVNGGEEGTGVLNINAENEGLDSELHLTLNGGIININSGNDGINTNEDGVSVTTVNGGKLTVKVNGNTGEGDGIDSNGWLVINGGTVYAYACSTSADAGIDSDMGIHINGGTVIATGHMLDRIESGGQKCALFNFAQKQSGGEKISIKNSNGDVVLEVCAENAYSVLVYSSPDLTEGAYTVCNKDGTVIGQSGSDMHGMGPGTKPERPNGGERPERPNDMKPNRDFEGGLPEDGQKPPEEFGGMVPPGGAIPPDAPPAEI